ncbi:hypothetical protein FRC07_003200 [Ceratobasidium sp. 392]|nr:hypothetical protein FRC07_003200 [Ceratobasidium sp. 392]
MFHCLFYKKDEQRPRRDAYGRQTSNLLTPKANTQRHYANAKEAWEICVEALAHPEVVTDYWEAKTIRKFATSYIPFRVRVTEGQKNQHVQAITATLTVNAGLGSTITYYDLRREFADDVSIKPSGQPTGLIVGHQDANITLKAAVTICVLVQMDTSRIFGAKVSA